MELTKEQNEALKMLDTQESIASVMETISVPGGKFRMCTNAIKSGRMLIPEKVVFPKDGGVLTYYDKMEYPGKGFPVQEVVERVDDIKRFLVTILNGFKGMVGGSKIKSILLILFFRKQFEAMLYELVHNLARHLQIYRLQERFYCTTVKAVMGAFKVLRDKNQYEVLMKRSKRNLDKQAFCINVMKIVTTVLEFDDAYRYRFQHVMGHMDKKKFSEDPFCEITRLVDIGLKSEESKRVTKGLKSVRSMLKILKFLPIKKDLILFLGALNTEEVRLSVGDMAFATAKKGYNWNVEYKCPDK